MAAANYDRQLGSHKFERHIQIRDTRKFILKDLKDSDLFPDIFPRILASSVPLRRAKLCGLDTETSYV